MTYKSYKEPVTEATVEVGSESFAVDVKRLYLPVTIKVKCPNCGGDITRDLRKHYLMYPSFNAVEKVGITHVVDDEECCSFFVNVKFGLTAEVAQ